LYQSTTTKFKFFIGDTHQESTALSNGWNHIVGTYDKTTMRLYINGSADTTQANTSAIPTSTDTLQIGRYNDSSSKAYSERIDDVRIYDRPLSAGEVLRNYKATKSKHKDNTVSNWSDDFTDDFI